MLDEKNQMIYEHLLADARIPVKKLASIIHSSQATVINRIDKLEKERYILRYDAIINWQKLPFIKKVYHLKAGNVKKACSFFDTLKTVFSIIELAGLYNLQVWCFFKTEEQCRKFEASIKNFEYISAEIEILEFPRVSFFNKSIKIASLDIKDEELKLDKIDIKIIKHLSAGGARDSLLEISYKLKIPYDTVHYRFKRLIKAGYFLKFIAQPGESAFTLQTTALQIRVKKEVNIEEFYRKISRLDKIISIAKIKDNGLLVHFNSLTFLDYQCKLNDIFSIERGMLELEVISHWKKIHLNNRYPLEFLLELYSQENKV